MTDNEISGARIGSIFDFKARATAEDLYDQFRRRNDCATVARNTGFSIEQVQIVKYYIFFERHYNKLGEFERFFPSYDMAESWRRLSEKKGNGIKPHDMTLLRHELYEIALLLNDSTLSQAQAHELANNVHNYQLESDRYYTSIGIKVK